MIEALIAYIQDKGFEVHVMPGYLLISKIVGAQIVSLSWAISRYELAMARTCEELLFLEADYRLAQMTKEMRKP